jgi:hypothetical protein
MQARAIAPAAPRRAHRPPQIPDLESLPPGATCTGRQVALAFGFAEVTIRTWRRLGRGPRVTMIEGRPRYLVRDLLAWRDQQ